MALIKCPKCGREISDKASRCVHCGTTIQKRIFTTDTDDSIRKWTKRMQIAGCVCAIGIIVTIIGIVLSISSGNRQQAQRAQSNNAITQPSKSTEAVEYTSSSSNNSNSGSSTKKSTYSSSSTGSSSKSRSSSFTNKYGTATTKCAHPGCSNYIASSGDTNCCTTHSRKCLECGKYIDEDAMYCMDCLTNAANIIKNGR